MEAEIEQVQMRGRRSKCSTAPRRRSLDRSRPGGRSSPLPCRTGRFELRQRRGAGERGREPVFLRGRRPHAAEVWADCLEKRGGADSPVAGEVRAKPVIRRSPQTWEGADPAGHA